MIFRHYKKGEESLLFEVFYSSIHMNANNNYTEKQLDSWAPLFFNLDEWRKKIEAINPFVLIVDNIIIGYADLQENGYIDHFFIRGGYNKKGYGSSLLKHIINIAKEKNILTLESNVSLAAQRLFEKFGFKIIKRNKVLIRKEILDNALMRVYLDK